MKNWMPRVGILQRLHTEKQLSPLIYLGDSRSKLFIYERLVQCDESGRLTPGLAESWERNADGTQYTFRLRAGAKFHDDTACDATAVKSYCEHWVKQEIHNWVGATSRVQKIEVIDERTLRFEMSAPYPLPYDLMLVNPPSIQSPKSLEEKPSVPFAGSGPYRIMDFDPQKRLLFGRFDEYDGTKPKLPFFEIKLTERYFPRYRGQIDALAAGELDLISDGWQPEIPRTEALSIAKEKKLKMMEAPATAVMFVGFNHTKYPFSEKRWRKKVALALNRKEVIDAAENGLADPVETLFSPSIATWPKKATPIVADKEGPETMTLDQLPIRAIVLATENDYGQIQTAQKVVEALRPLGIEALIEVDSYHGIAQRRAKNQYDLFVNTTWGLPYDPHATLYANFYPSMTQQTVKDGPAYYINKDLTPLVEASWKAKNEAELAAAYQKVQDHIDQEVAVVPLYSYRRIALMRPEVSGYRFTPTGYDLDLSNLTIEEKDEEEDK